MKVTKEDCAVYPQRHGYDVHLVCLGSEIVATGKEVKRFGCVSGDAGKGRDIRAELAAARPDDTPMKRHGHMPATEGGTLLQLLLGSVGTGAPVRGRQDTRVMWPHGRSVNR